jgi:hypothetical protein
MQSLLSPHRLSSRVLRPSAAPVMAAVIVFAASLSAIADDTAGPPAREGNIYDHKDHQPTEAELRAAEKAAGVPGSSAPGNPQVEEGVKQLLDQTDALDKRSEREGRSGSSEGR